MTDEHRRFRIVQLDVPGASDVPDGRWVVRGHANRPQAVVVVQTSQRPRRGIGRRLARDPAGDASVPIVRYSVIDAEPLNTDDPARWLKAIGTKDTIGRCVAVLRRLSDLRAVAAADPQPRVVRPDDVVRAAIGYGTGEHVAAGNAEELREILAPGDQPEKVRRSGKGTGPEERLAELLSGRDAVLAAELLTMRARDDLAGGRSREAALQLRVALEAAIAELEPWRHLPELDPLLNDLRDARTLSADVAGAAVRGGLSDEQVDTVTEIVDQLAYALRKRSMGRRHGEAA